MPGQGFLREPRPQPVAVIFGPTASGKTAVLEKLFAGHRFAAEVVSADSMQVYRGMDIGTAKAGPDLRRRLPHHLIDIRDPDEPFNAGEFVRLADAAAAEIAGRGKLPVVSGGTGFYLKNFVLGLPEAPPSDPEIRSGLKKELAEKGVAPLAGELAACDPVSAARIHTNDTYRLLRALEVYRLTGLPLSSFPTPLAGKKNPDNDAPGGLSAAQKGRLQYRFLLIGLRCKREELYRRIDERCGLMFREGLAEEVAALAARGYGPKAPGMRAIGYREFFSVNHDGGFSVRTDTGNLIELISRNCRRYAKRQITCFSSLKDVNWIAAGGAEKAAEEIADLLSAFLSKA